MMKVHMEFTFPDREEKDLEQLNALLSSVNWSEVHLEDFNGYHAKTSTMDQNTGTVCSVTHRYGFDRVVLECEQEKDEPGHRYQVETEYRTQEVSSDEYHDCWSEAHPDCVMRVLDCLSFDDGGSAFVVLFHERTTGDGESGFIPVPSGASKWCIKEVIQRMIIGLEELLGFEY